MKPNYKQNYTKDIFDHLTDLEWLSVTEARKEYLMADEVGISYTYGKTNFARTYVSKAYSEQVKNIQDQLNFDFGYKFNACFLNRYDDQHNQLSWHADDSPEMNMNHDICVISFGAKREIWWKQKDFKGIIPNENKQLLEPCSLFTMPSGFQKDNLHRIPRCDRQCGTRISLTFRDYIK